MNGTPVTLGEHLFVLHQTGLVWAVESRWAVIATPSDTARQPALFEPEVTETDMLRALVAELNPARLLAILVHDDGALPQWLAPWAADISLVGAVHANSIVAPDGWTIRSQPLAGDLGLAGHPTGDELDFAISTREILLPWFRPTP